MVFYLRFDAPTVLDDLLISTSGCRQPTELLCFLAARTPSYQVFPLTELSEAFANTTPSPKKIEVATFFNPWS